MNDLDQALEDYVELFQEEPPEPYGISDERLARVLREHVAKGEKIPEDFDWWGDLPDGADA